MHDSSSIRKLIQIFLSLKKNQQKKIHFASNSPIKMKHYIDVFIRFFLKLLSIKILQSYFKTKQSHANQAVSFTSTGPFFTG